MLNKQDLEQSYTLKMTRRTIVRKTSYNHLVKTFTYTYLAFFVLLALYPFFWAIMQSFNNSNLISTSGINPFPHKGFWTLDNYAYLFTAPSTKRLIRYWLLNSVLYSFATATLNTFFNFLGGYALARISFKGKKSLIFYFLVSIIIPAQATMIPTYAIYQFLGLFNRHLPNQIWFIAIVFKGMANIVLTLQIRQFYLTQKGDVEEAARVEGLSRFAAFFRVSIRQMLPLFAIQFTLVFIGGWNDFLLFKLFSNGTVKRYNLTTGILNLASSSTGTKGTGVALALSTLTFIPMFTIYGITLRIQARGMHGGYK